MGLFVDRRLRLYFACGLRGGALSAASVATRNNKFKLPTASAGSSGMNQKLSTTALGLTLALSVSAAVEAKTLVFCSEGRPEGFNTQIYTDGTTFAASSRQARMHPAYGKRSAATVEPR